MNRESSKQYVERVFPGASGTLKGSLILAHGCGYDAAMRDALEIIQESFVAVGLPAEFMEALTVNVSIPQK